MKRHSLDVLSLVFGLIFLLVAGSWIVRQSLHVQLPGPGWYIAGALIVAGVFGIISTLRGSLSKAQADQPPVPQPIDSTQEFGTVTESGPEDRGF
jgi:hypothetical protein